MLSQALRVAKMRYGGAKNHENLQSLAKPGHISAPGQPGDLSPGLSILIFSPLSISEDEEADFLGQISKSPGSRSAATRLADSRKGVTPRVEA